MARIEMHLTEEEVAVVEKIAKKESRSRKKQCEFYIKKMIDELPKEGDYGINPNAPDAKARLVERFSEQNETLGFRLEPESWFSWLPLRDYHRKVVFDNCQTLVSKSVL